MALEQNKQSCLIESDEFFLSEGTNNLHDGICLPNGAILCDRFIIKKHLGNSNNSIFYLAKDTLRKMELVIKAVDVGPCGKKFADIQLKLEMDIYKKLSDPNIINVYDLHPVIIGGAKLLIMTMDYAEKGSFKQWLANSGNVDIRRANGMKFFKQICRGLGAAHNQGIIHLDVNPENILLTSKFLKISNFALSNHVQIELLSAGHNLDSFFKSASCPAYMSPELFNTPHPEELTAAADVYSLGIMLYELYHPKCRTPFSGSYSHIRDLHLNVPIKKIENLNDNLSDIISRCLEKDPGKRYQNAWELLEALEKKSKKKNQNIIEEKWQKASNFYEQKNFVNAMTSIKEILSINPNHDLSVQLQSELMDRFSQAEQFYNEIKLGIENKNGDLKTSLELLKEAIEIYPDHPAGVLIQHKLIVLSERYKNYMEKGNKAIESHKLEEALYLFQQVQEIESGSEILKRRIEILLRIKDMRQQIEENLSKRNFNQARRLAHLIDLKIMEIKK